MKSPLVGICSSSRLVVPLVCLLAMLRSWAADGAPSRWWKGNLHTHSLWSDGDDYPEMIAAWYKDQGYHFLAISDHNVMQLGERWLNLTPKRGGGEALQKYLQRYGDRHVQQRVLDGTNQIRLQPLAEYRVSLEQPGRFLLIPSEEITDRHHTAPVHLNVTNLKEPLAPAGGTNVVDVIQRNINAVREQRASTGQAMFLHVNHPNFGWGITAEELMRIEGDRFFEVYNGHPSVHNEGDATHASTERMWDIVLTWRLAVLNLPLMYGIAVDDSHSYHTNGVQFSNPGRGWVMVRAPKLTPDSLIHAMEAGEFYGSSGVLLKNVRRERRRLVVTIDAEPGVTYRTQFIGTRKQFDPANEPIRAGSGTPLRVTHRYSPEVGQILAEVKGPVARYKFKGDELYVRAKVISTKPMANPYREGETAAAWVQPVRP